MATLGGILASLTNEDGSPDFKARRQQLDSLMSQMLSSERRYVKERLDALTTPTWTVDFIPKLPVELVICISDYMALPDFAVVQMVSKSWYECFTRSNIIHHLARKHFSMAWETSLKTATPSARLTMFNSLFRRENAINQGNYRSMECYSYGSSDTSGSIRRLNGNRIAWTSKEMIFVRNLITRDTKRFVTPERHRVTGLCMRGDCLLAVCASSSTILYAWSITTGTMHQIRLPSIPLFFDTDHGNVLASVTDGSVLKWVIGQQVRQLNLPILSKGSKVIFLACDPLSKETFIRCFVQLVRTPTNETTQSESPRKTLRLVAEKFKDDGILLSSSAIDICLSEDGRTAFEDVLGDNAGRILKTASGNAGLDENGYHSVILLPNFIETANCVCLQSESSTQGCGYVWSYSFLRVYFSIIENRWRKDPYATPSRNILGDLTGPAPVNSIHFTKNRALVPVIPDEDLSHTANAFFVVGIEPQDEEGISQHQTTVRLRCICGPDGNNVAYRELITGLDKRLKPEKFSFFYNSGLRYALARETIPDTISLSIRYETLALHTLASRFQICSSSTFTILFGPTGYIVWCYDKDITLPQPSDYERMILKSWPTRPLI